MSVKTHIEFRRPKWYPKWLWMPKWLRIRIAAHGMKKRMKELGFKFRKKSTDSGQVTFEFAKESHE